LNEHDALQVLLVKSFETQASDNELLSEAERREATRTALEAVSPQAAPDAFIAARARAARRSLARLASVDWIFERQGWRPTWLLLAIGLGLLVGITADVFGGITQLNLLAPHVWLVIVWNAAVYFALCTALFRGEPRWASARSGWIANAARGITNFWYRRLHQHASSSTPQALALADFSGEWTRTSLPLATTRLITLLHTASAAVAVGLIATMYLRFFNMGYGPELSNNFTGTEFGHKFLSFFLSPAQWISGIAPPELIQMQATEGASNEQKLKTVLPWFHLYAIMLLITVVLPRTLLACWSGWQAHRMSRHFPLSLDEQYYRNILRARRNEPIQIHILPYALTLTDDAQQNLRRILELAYDNSLQIERAATIALGGEDDLNGLPASLTHATQLVALFDMRATPEAEYHGAFLSALDAAQVPVIIVVNESGFASRFRDYPQRLNERREAWTAFCSTFHKNPLFFDLVAPHMNSYVTALRSAIDASVAA
jgi:hypothetical protein